MIFGIGDLALLVRRHIESESEHQVVAHAVHTEYLESPSLDGVDVVAFESLSTSHPPDEVSAFVAIGYRNMNEERATIVGEMSSLGYMMISHISPDATVMDPLSIGGNSIVMAGTLVEPYVEIGSNVIVWSGCQLSHHVKIRDHCYLGPRVALAGRVMVESYSFLGLNSSVRDHVTIGSRTVVGMGVTILDDTEPGSVYKAPAPQLLNVASGQLEDL